MSLATTLPQIPKLLLMLSSPYDSEVIAAARAIGNALQRAGCDWHDLVKGLHLSAVHSNTEEDWRDDVACCAENMGYFDDREQDFLRSMARWRGQPSQKQRDWLAALADRVWVAA